MNPLVRIIGIVCVFVLASIAWMILGGTMGSRTYDVSSRLDGAVDNLWGSAQDQRPPDFVFHWQTQREDVRTETTNGRVVKVKDLVVENHQKLMPLESTDIDVKLHSDLRRKGLMWFSLYDAAVKADWSYVHNEAIAGNVAIGFAFPSPYGLYDDFKFMVNGTDYAATLTPTDGRVGLTLSVKPGDHIALHVEYKTRGSDQWSYTPAQGVLTNFKLAMATDFTDIDYPQSGLSPSNKARTSDGWQLNWSFEQVVTGRGIGIVTPTRLQPGELAAAMSFSAPVSLLFFFVIIYVLAALRKISIHPFNYLLIAAAFFAFHLLFAYTVDRLPVEAAFGLASVVSVILVVSYLRLVVSARFALVEAGLAQLVYLVGFSLAHFAVGFTGLAITILAIITLFIVMQLTGRIRFSEQKPKAPGSALQMPAPSPTPHA